MTPVNIFFIVFSPYTAFLPMIYLGFRILQKREMVYKNPWNIGLMFMFAWSLGVGAANDNQISSAASVAILLYLFLSIYIQNYYTDEKKIDKLLNTIVLFSTASAIIGILEKLTSIYYDTIWWGNLLGIPSYIYYKEGYRIFSTFGNPNVAGAWFAAMVLVCFYFFEKSLKTKRILYGAALCLFTIVLILTGSRGAGLGLEFGLIVYAYIKQKRESIIQLAIVFLIIGVFMFIIPELFPASNAITSSMNHEVGHSVSNRRAIWLACLEMFKSKPVTGWGLLGIFFAGSDIFHYYNRQPHGHNIWITIATTLGIVGLCAYVYMHHYIIDRIKLLYNKGCTLSPLFAGIQALVIGHGLVDFTIMTPQGGIIFFGCSALISSLAIQYSYSDDDSIFELPWLDKKGLQWK